MGPVFQPTPPCLAEAQRRGAGPHWYDTQLVRSSLFKAVLLALIRVEVRVTLKCGMRLNLMIQILHWRDLL